MPAALSTPSAFIDHWQKAEANERANSQSFLIGLAHILGVPPPSNNHADGYSFEFPVKVPGGTSTNFIDLYRRARFILEWKQFTAQKLEQSALELAAIEAGAAGEKKKTGVVRGTGGWDDAMIRANEQALHAAKTPVTAADLTKNFSRAKPHDIQEILESLVTLGRARMEGERFSG